MIQTSPSLSVHTKSTYEQEFVELLLSDEDFVQAIFEDIIAAEWPPAARNPSKTPPNRASLNASGRPPELPSRRTSSPGRQPPSRRPGGAEWSRERSPPWASLTASSTASRLRKR